MTEKVKVIYIANASSPHVRHWIEFLDEMNIEYHIYSIHKNSFFLDSRVTVKYNFLLKFGGIGAILAYILLGFWLKFFLGNNLLHAHNTSGYGLSALLSGKPYIVTSYGTEIFGANKRSIFYNIIIKNVLRKARLITTTSITMEEVLKAKFGVENERIKTFGMGVSSKFKFNSSMRGQIRDSLGIPHNAVVWVYNRRITPLYNTLEVINAFKVFTNGMTNKYLILMEGDKDIVYAKQVEREIKDCDNVFLVEGFLEQHMMSYYLSAADVAISFPKSDQLSSSILEAVACGCLPMLTNLDSYEPIFKHITSIPVTIDDIVNGFYKSDDLIANFGKEVRYKIISEYEHTEWGRDNVMGLVKEIYDYK